MENPKLKAIITHSINKTLKDAEIDILLSKGKAKNKKIQDLKDFIELLSIFKELKKNEDQLYQEELKKLQKLDIV